MKEGVGERLFSPPPLRSSMVMCVPIMLYFCHCIIMYLESFIKYYINKTVLYYTG